MDLTALFKEETVLVSLEAETRDECIEKMTDSLVEAGIVADKKIYMEAVLNREKTGSTGIGFGVAIPHGKSESVKEPGLAFAKLVKSVEWQSLDDNPVEIVFLIAVPQEKAGDEHLRILAAISRKLIHDEFRAQLLKVTSYQDLLDILK